MNKVKQELLEATGIKEKKRHTEQKLMKRLCGACDDLTDDAWDKLSASAQLWVNAGIDATKEDEEISDFPEDKKEKRKSKKKVEEQQELDFDNVTYEEVQEMKLGVLEELVTELELDLDGEDYDDELDEFRKDVCKELKLKKPRKGKSKKSRKVKKENEQEEEKQAEPKVAKKKGKPVTVAVREVICDYMDLSRKEIGEKLEELEIEAKESTVNTIYASSHTFLKILKAKDMLK